MKFIRYQHGKTEYRGISDGNVIKRISGSIFHDYSISPESISIDDVKLLPAIIPSKVVCIVQSQGTLYPSFYLKPSSSLIADTEDVVMPSKVDSLYASTEVAIIMNRKCKNVTKKSAESFILGYSIANNITTSATAITSEHSAYDTFTPISSIINTSLDDDITISIDVNGIKTACNIKTLNFDICHIVSFVSSIMTLQAGDIILTGALHERINVANCDVITCDATGLGKVSNKITVNHNDD